MLTLKEIRQFIADLGIASDANTYIGKLDNKKQPSIGVYNLKPRAGEQIALGGLKQTSHQSKAVSFLVHWDKSISNAEEAANRLYNALIGKRDIKMGDCDVLFIRMLQSEPVDVGTDDNGVYEFVIEIEIFYQRKD